MSLRVYNTLTRQKEPFQTQQAGKVGMYVCGPTVYKPSHIGHMVGPVLFDTVKRYLTYLGYNVNFVVNITDVDDKLIVRAKEQNTTVQALAERMTADYLDCLKQLNVTGIDRMPKATEHIPEMLDMISQLIAKGLAYPAGGDVYFDISKDDDYGKLCHRDPEQMEAGARIEVSERKRNPGDFALWKGSKPGEPAWDSPWGPGRPGWHIECSAMSMKYLGQTLDIHGGGLDLQFPHHENELAQSESFSGKPFASYWMHNGLMRMRVVQPNGTILDGKMAGSVGNVLNVVDLLKLVPGEVLRFFLISTHYRSPIDLGEFNPSKDKLPAALPAAQKGYDGFVRFTERYQRITGASFYALTPNLKQGERTYSSANLAEFNTRFHEFMADDFNTGGAVGVLFELLNVVNRVAEDGKLEAATPDATKLAAFREGALLLKELGAILGLFLTPLAAPLLACGDGLVEGLLQLLVDVRAECRKSKNFALGDVIRKRLTELGVTLEDRAGGTGWRIERG